MKTNETKIVEMAELVSRFRGKVVVASTELDGTLFFMVSFHDHDVAEQFRSSTPPEYMTGVPETDILDGNIYVEVSEKRREHN